ncbi:unnamed protein product [Medioppia subpectinata]|uniref:Uncharacterized protein n=1 Tax=Medioppia subpectinata TaxID=1979941 RepID=A0A7R9PT17_9ACAR|nr:unnamed protein product [Medioppia subpectinata]CAG2100016.1 unnamed protein product [Medioppia subpectinata]
MTYVLNVKVKSNQKHNTTLEKQSLYDTERDGRQFAGGYSPGFGGDYGLTGFGGPLEAIIIGLCVVAGFGIIGIPFILLFLSFFNGGGLGTTGGIGGLNLVPTTTTTVAGRKRREINSLLPEVNPMLQQNRSSTPFGYSFPHYIKADHFFRHYYSKKWLSLVNSMAKTNFVPILVLFVIICANHLIHANIKEDANEFINGIISRKMDVDRQGFIGSSLFGGPLAIAAFLLSLPALPALLMAPLAVAGLRPTIGAVGQFMNSINSGAGLSQGIAALLTQPNVDTETAASNLATSTSNAGSLNGLFTSFPNYHTIR